MIAGRDRSNRWLKIGFLDYELSIAKKEANREKFTACMEAALRWHADCLDPELVPQSVLERRQTSLLA